MNTQTSVSECLQEADEVIQSLKEAGYDYSHKRAEIALLFDTQLYNGNWDCTTDFDDGTPDLRLIQEDEYDQHMDDEDKPDSVTYAAGHYVMLA